MLKKKEILICRGIWVDIVFYNLGGSFMKNNRLILFVAMFLLIAFIFGCADQAELPEKIEEKLKDEAEGLEPAPELGELALTDAQAIQTITGIIEQRFFKEKEETGDAYVLDFITYDPDENKLTIEVIYPEKYRDFYQIEDEFYKTVNGTWARFIVEDIPGLLEKEFNLALIAISEPLSSKDAHEEADKLGEESQTETEGEESSSSGKLTVNVQSDFISPIKLQIICSTDYFLDTNEYVFTGPRRLRVTDSIPLIEKPVD